MAAPLTTRPGYRSPMSAADKLNVLRLWDTGQFPCKDRLAKHLGLDWTQIDRIVSLRHKYEEQQP